MLEFGAALAGITLVTVNPAYLANYKVPRVWRFVEQFPQTASEKIQKFALQEQFLAQTQRK